MYTLKKVKATISAERYCKTFVMYWKSVRVDQSIKVWKRMLLEIRPVNKGKYVSEKEIILVIASALDLGLMSPIQGISVLSQTH